MPYTVVSFHAHPDDEALLTAGTLARAAAEGHRVVLVCATDGAHGLTTGGAGGALDGAALAATRAEELRRAATAVGCHDVRMLGYEDSGMDGTGGTPGATFATAAVEEAAGRLAAVLTETGADVLTVYDPAGGYGHPDHVQVHRVGTAAAALAGTPVVLEATVDRAAVVRVLRVLALSGVARLLGVDRREWSPHRFAHAFADPARITHRVDVRPYLAAKRAAMAAHASQARADDGVRTLAVFVRLPAALYARAFGREWFVEQGRAPGGGGLDDIFASLRPDPGPPGGAGGPGGAGDGGRESGGGAGDGPCRGGPGPAGRGSQFRRHRLRGRV